MKPRQNALRSNLIRFFTDNPDEELTMDDICSKFGCTEMQARVTLQKINSERKIKLRKTLVVSLDRADK